MFSRKEIKSIQAISQSLILDDDRIDIENDIWPCESSKRSRIGWCYALISESMPGLVKIGSTQKCPIERSAQLSRQTSCPTPFELLYCQRYLDCRSAEGDIHYYLRKYRVNGKEFFRTPLKNIIVAFHYPNAKPAEGDRHDL